MADTAAARAAEQFTEQARKLAKAKEAVTETVTKNLETVTKNLEEGLDSARRAYNRGRDAAEDAIDDTQRLIKRRPFESVGVGLAVGFIAGAIFGVLLRRK